MPQAMAPQVSSSPYPSHQQELIEMPVKAWQYQEFVPCISGYYSVLIAQIGANTKLTDTNEKKSTPKLSMGSHSREEKLYLLNI